MVIISDIDENDRKIYKDKIEEMTKIYELQKIIGISYNDDVMVRLMLVNAEFVLHQDMEYFRKYMEVMGEIYKILMGEEERG